LIYRGGSLYLGISAFIFYPLIIISNNYYSININNLLNRGSLYSSFNNTLIHASSKPLNIILEPVPTLDNLINSVEYLIIINYPINYISSPPLLILITLKPRLGCIRSLSSIKRTLVPSLLYSTIVLLS
jgi:hypothetical protein